MDELIAIEIMLNVEKRCKVLYHQADHQHEIQLLNDAANVWAHVDYWADSVMGYSSSITKKTFLLDTTNAYHEQAVKSLDGLKHLNIFRNEAVYRWYNDENSQQYPLIRDYINGIDYLRLLAINYLEMHVLVIQIIPN